MNFTPVTDVTKLEIVTNLDKPITTIEEREQFLLLLQIPASTYKHLLK